MEKRSAGVQPDERKERFGAELVSLDEGCGLQGSAPATLAPSRRKARTVRLATQCRLAPLSPGLAPCYDQRLQNARLYL